MEHKSIRNIMFHANDLAKHDVYWSDAGQSWNVENEKEGLIRSFDTLCSALTCMHMRSTEGQGMGYGTLYAMMVPDHWTITDNPYAGKE